ncbi:hypothetical protein CHS0354_006460 [Potamilus streckersoni]|uniref:CHMP7 winged helix domain-containing protein n=1 Tax=Potamilus streckersoni TaxID=2493646 RepID=A0AAE0T913_9BIVA|nr:hypothetical protein CHS0354_006460 [Potamilus streckersoni]
MESSLGKHSSEWDDDTKMTVLFSPFREKNLNPRSWEQKVMFWTEMIQNEGHASGEAIISLKSLPGKFERKGRTPVCLQIVIEEMIRNGKLKKLSDLQQQDSVGWLSWGFSKLIKQPIKWSFQLLPWQNSGKKEEDDLYVLDDILKEKMDKLIESHCAAEHCDITDNVLEYSELREQQRQLCPSDLEFSLVIQELARIKRVQLYSMGNNTTLVKFTKNVGEKAVDPVSEQDLHILRIKKSHEEVTRQIEKSMKEVRRLTEEAKMHKAKDMIKLALSSLRKRRLVQKRIEKLTGSLELLEDLLSRIRQAHSDEKVLEAVKSGTATLKVVTGKQSADSVAKFMDDLAEVTQEQDDIMSEMSFTSHFDVASQDELEAELDAILGEEEEEEEEEGKQIMPRKSEGQSYRVDEITAALNELNLPDVPCNSAGSMTPSQKTKRQLEET